MNKYNKQKIKHMNTFKHGDAVTCIIDETKIDDAKVSIDRDGTPYICQNFKDGLAGEDRLGYKYAWCLSNDFRNVSVTDLKLAPKKKDINDISTYEVGDVLVPKNPVWDFLKVRVLLGDDIIIVSPLYWDTDNISLTSTSSLAKKGYKFKDTQPEKFSVENPPKDGEVYFTINKYEGLDGILWINSQADRFCLVTNNCYRTEQEAREWYEDLIK